MNRWELIQGESLAALRGMPAAIVDAVITDPPYSSGGMFRGDRTAKTSEKYQNSGTARTYPEFTGDSRDQRGWIAWCSLWLGECYRVAKDGAPVLVFTDWRMLPAATDALQAAGFVWRGIVPWDKGQGVRPQPGRFRQQAEYVVWGSKGGMPVDRKAPVLPGAYQVTVRQADKHHVTGKPTDLMRQLARICEPDSLILDPFAGSGSTGVGALLEGHRFIGVELSDEYAAIARQRLDATQWGVSPPPPRVLLTLLRVESLTPRGRAGWRETAGAPGRRSLRPGSFVTPSGGRRDQDPDAQEPTQAGRHATLLPQGLRLHARHAGRGRDGRGLHRRGLCSGLRRHRLSLAHSRAWGDRSCVALEGA